MVDLGTGNNNKINWAFNNRQEFIDILETVFRGARKGRGLVISPKDYSTKYRYQNFEAAVFYLFISVFAYYDLKKKEFDFIMLRMQSLNLYV